MQKRCRGRVGCSEIKIAWPPINYKAVPAQLNIVIYDLLLALNYLIISFSPTPCVERGLLSPSVGITEFLQFSSLTLPYMIITSNVIFALRVASIFEWGSNSLLDANIRISISKTSQFIMNQNYVS